MLELFVLGVPVYRQRFDTSISAKSRERFYRLIRACMAQQEQLREPFGGALECDEATFGGARHGKRGRVQRVKSSSSASSNAMAKSRPPRSQRMTR
ncbi:hypothetical protein [Burkholderia multivorans]|uniref:hypothetical protein n=1 Tax=Burkholderia multivorans TaxID=87883 RepID=UPI00209E7181|nr:hypothetical protein [Burkholderia multivorans]